MANPAFLTMVSLSTTNCSSSEFTTDICVDGDRDANIAFRYANCAKACAFDIELETQYRRKDGTPLPVNTYSAVAAAPSQQTFLTLAVDITSRQAAEDALRAAQSELGGLLD